MNDLERGLYNKAIDLYGADLQMNMGIEECAELIKALSKLVRCRGLPAQPYLHLMAMENIIEELADVQIMVEQISILVGEVKVKEAKKRKLERLAERVATDEARWGGSDENGDKCEKVP